VIGDWQGKESEKSRVALEAAHGMFRMVIVTLLLLDDDERNQSVI
jgi:hypothetical protein